MDTLGFIFEKKPSIRDNRPKYNDKLCQPVPGHPELTSNKMAQIWNYLKLNKLVLLNGIGKIHKVDSCDILFYFILLKN